MHKALTDRKVISWCFYDFANSVFYTTVMAGFFPVFFKKYWSEGVSPVESTARLGWILSLSGFLLAILSPTLGAISDQRRNKKKFLALTMILGVFCTLGLSFVTAGQWLQAAILYGAALFMCSASCVFYDSLLPSVCEPQDYDFVSSLGYSLGYLGGGVLFVLNVLMYTKPELFGLSDGVMAVRWSFATVAVWWLVFSVPLLKYVPEPQMNLLNTTHSAWQLTLDSLNELKQTLKHVFENKNVFIFVISYWLYIDAVYTVMSMAVDFGMALGFNSSDLIKALLITQFIGFPAAYLFGALSSKFTNRNLILLSLVIYAAVIVASTHMRTVQDFYILAAVIGLAQGGVQALSRSLFAQLTPLEKSGEYFGFFNLLGKFASVLGPALVAIFASLTNDSRQAMLSLLILILGGGVLLTRVKPKQS